MPRAQYADSGGFSASGGFSDPWGSNRSGGGRVYGTSSDNGSASPDTGATPGTFGVDVTSPQGLIGSMGASANESSNFIHGMGLALWGPGTPMGGAFLGAFGKDNGSLLGGTPIGALAQFVGGIPGGVGDTLNNAAKVIGGAAEHVGIGSSLDAGEQSQAQYDALPADLRAEYDKQIEASPEIAGHIRYLALQANADRQQKVSPKLNPYEDIPRTTLADTLGYMLGPLMGQPQRTVERGIAGWTRASGLNRLQEIEAIANGAVGTGVLGTGFLAGDRQLTDVEQTALTNWQSGTWSPDQALTYLAASGSGLSHDKALQIAGTFATDPTVVAGLGASGLAKLGMTGAELVAAGEGVALREAGTASKLNVLGKMAEGKVIKGIGPNTNDLVRLVGKQYAGLEGTTLGRAAKVTRTIIDPLHALGERRIAGEAAVDAVAEIAPRAVAEAYGDGTVRNMLRYVAGVSEDGAMLDMVARNHSTYSANLGRDVIAEAHQADMLSQGLGADLVQSRPADMIGALTEGAPKDIGTAMKTQAIGVRVLKWDAPAERNLAERMADVYPFKTADEYATDIAKMTPDEKGLLHAWTYGQITEEFLGAVGASRDLYAGKVPLNRMVLLNRSRLTDVGAKGILDELAQATLTPDVRAELVKTAQARYPELRYVTIDPANPSRSIERFAKWLQSQLDEGTIPAQLVDDEIAKLPPALQALHVKMRGEWTFGFRPEDDLLWSLRRDLEGGYEAFSKPWVDHVADAVPAYRPTTSLLYNIAGQPLPNTLVRGALKPIDFMASAANTIRAKVTSAQITEAARTRFSAGAQVLGMTDAEGKAVFQGIVEAAGLHETSARGLLAKDMWRAVESVIPGRLYDTGLVGKREIMNLVLNAYEGDLRFVGLTQKFTGRVKTMLGPVGGNALGFMAENLYPTVKYRLNALFQVQERIEPMVLNAQRGVNFAFGNKMNETDRITSAILERMVETGVTRVADVDQWEFSAQALATSGGEAALKRSVPSNLWNTLTDVQGVKRLNMLRTFGANLGRELRPAMERAKPGLWDEVKAHYQAGSKVLLRDDDVATRWVAEQMFGNDIQLAGKLVKPGATAGMFDNAIKAAEWHVPASIGELKALDLDFLAKRLGLPLGDGRHTVNAADLRAGLAANTVTMERIEDALVRLGAHPDYVRRVNAALTFSWKSFWGDVSERYSLSRAESTHLQNMMSKAAEVRGMTPVEYVSQVFSPTVMGGTNATIEELGKSVSILRATKDATADDLIRQMTDVFVAHLDPSAREGLLQAFGRDLPGEINDLMVEGHAAQSRQLQKTLENLRGGWSEETNGAFAKRVVAMANGAKEADPDVIRAVGQFAKWSKAAMAEGLVRGRSEYAELFAKLGQIDTRYAAPFNKTHQMLVNQVTNAMRMKEQDAFRLQYFARERTWFERSINHPFFGIYPASYMWGKIAPELIRFVARTPFGVQTGAMLNSFADVQKAIAIQREYDPEFDAAIEKIGSSQALWFLGYLLPAVPWDISAAMPSYARNIAQQGLDNEARVARGEAAKPIDISVPLQKVSDYVSPFRSAFQVDRVLSEVLTPPKTTEAPPPPTGGVGPLQAVDIAPTLEQQMQALQKVLAGQ